MKGVSTPLNQGTGFISTCPTREIRIPSQFATPRAPTHEGGVWLNPNKPQYKPASPTREGGVLVRTGYLKRVCGFVPRVKGGVGGRRNTDPRWKDVPHMQEGVTISVTPYLQNLGYPRFFPAASTRAAAVPPRLRYLSKLVIP